MQQNWHRWMFHLFHPPSMMYCASSNYLTKIPMNEFAHPFIYSFGRGHGWPWQHQNDRPKEDRWVIVRIANCTQALTLVIDLPRHLVCIFHDNRTDAWWKLLSQSCTIRYIRCHNTPLPDQYRMVQWEINGTRGIFIRCDGICWMPSQWL